MYVLIQKTKTIERKSKSIVSIRERLLSQKLSRNDCISIFSQQNRGAWYEIEDKTCCYQQSCRVLPSNLVKEWICLTVRIISH